MGAKLLRLFMEPRVLTMELHPVHFSLKVSGFRYQPVNTINLSVTCATVTKYSQQVHQFSSS